ncbi:MAG TPA: hypothetical protein PKD55_04700, partial [Bellilinea sp.]|nr:hypothetical protein [Bellilinea sp.]
LIKQIAHIYGYTEQEDGGHMNLLAMAEHIGAHVITGQMERLGPQGRKLAATLLGLSGTWALGLQTHARYNGGWLPRRIANWIGRNGRYDHAAPTAR